MSERTLTTLAAAVLIGATPPAIAPAGAQATIVDAGSYELRAGDSVVGTETFTIRREGQTVQGVGRHELSADASPFRAIEVWLEANGSWRPSVFRLQTRVPRSTNVLALRDERRFRVNTESPEGNRWREYVAPPELVVLEPTAAHHYTFLLRQHADRLGAEETLEVPALVPSRGGQLTLVLRPGREVPLEWSGRTVATRRYDLTLDSEALRVWRAEDGRILRVEAPGRWSATRTTEE